MTKVQFGVVVGFLSAIVFLLLAPYVATDRLAPKWDYKIEGFKDEELVQWMNKRGEGGWELVFARRALDDGKGAYEVIFKRPR